LRRFGIKRALIGRVQGFACYPFAAYRAAGDEKILRRRESVYDVVAGDHFISLYVHSSAHRPVVFRGSGLYRLL
jgi:hypothetical protein